MCSNGLTFGAQKGMSKSVRFAAPPGSSLRQELVNSEKSRLVCRKLSELCVVAKVAALELSRTPALWSK